MEDEQTKEKHWDYTITNHFIGDKESAKPSLFKRDSYKDCVSQIVSDCEEAARRLL